MTTLSFKLHISSHLFTPILLCPSSIKQLIYILLPRQHVQWCCLYFDQSIHLSSQCCVWNLYLRVHCEWTKISCWGEIHLWLQHLVCAILLALLFLRPLHGSIWLTAASFIFLSSFCSGNVSACTLIGCPPSKQLITLPECKLMHTSLSRLFPPSHTVYSSLHTWRHRNCW